MFLFLLFILCPITFADRVYSSAHNFFLLLFILYLFFYLIYQRILQLLILNSFSLFIFALGNITLKFTKLFYIACGFLPCGSSLLGCLVSFPDCLYYLSFLFPLSAAGDVHSYVFNLLFSFPKFSFFLNFLLIKTKIPNSRG